MEAGGAPLYETLEASFPTGLMLPGIEYTMKHRIRRRLRHIGYRVLFPDGEDWQQSIECFAIAGLERCCKTFGDHPFFWVIAWPAVMGAAAADFWPEMGAPAERRAVASEAAREHLEELLVSRALADPDAVGSLPSPAVRGLKAIGQSTLPALPTKGLGTFNGKNDAAGWKPSPVVGAPWCPGPVTARPFPGALRPAPMAIAERAWEPPPLPMKATQASTAPLALPAPCEEKLTAAPSADQKLAWQPPTVKRSNAPPPPPGPPPPGASPPAPERQAAAMNLQPPPKAPPTEPLDVSQAPAVGADAPAVQSSAAAGSPCLSHGGMTLVERIGVPEAYGDNGVICDICYEPCGEASSPFWHCEDCQYDICGQCGAKQQV